MATLDLNRLTKEEQIKLTTIAKMIKVGLPEYIKDTDKIEEQIQFIKKHAGGNHMFYTDSWYLSNERRTRSIYYQTRNKYNKNYAKQRKIHENATESAKRLLAKSLTEKINA